MVALPFLYKIFFFKFVKQELISLSCIHVFSILVSIKGGVGGGVEVPVPLLSQLSDSIETLNWSEGYPL